MWRFGPAGDHAFTLLEVLVVMTILSLVGTASALGWPNTRDRMKLSQASTWIERMLTDLRAQARREGRARSVEFDIPAKSYRLPDAVWRPLPPDVEWSLGSGWRAIVTFVPDGTASETVITMRAGRFSTARRIDSLTGTIRRGEL